ncbi:hypothetical protein BHE74_00026320 [Ensete ventricosum]|nr:hypothetical protein BHE74_00026320 [Ensete ventricosum]
MWHRAFAGGGAANPWRSLARRSLSAGASSAVDSIILRSLKDHYLEVSKMTPPPRVNPPSPYTIVKGALDQDGPVLRRSYKEEEINISVMRLSNIMPSGADDDDGDGDDSISQLFLHIDVSKPGRDESLQFLCGLYPDAVGIHSVCLRPKVTKSSGSTNMTKYQGRVFQYALQLPQFLSFCLLPFNTIVNLILLRAGLKGPGSGQDCALGRNKVVFVTCLWFLNCRELEQKMRDAFHIFIETRGINDKLFPFLQAWLYVKDHRNLMRWFKSVGTFINEQKPA